MCKYLSGDVYIIHSYPYNNHTFYIYLQKYMYITPYRSARCTHHDTGRRRWINLAHEIFPQSLGNECWGGVGDWLRMWVNTTLTQLDKMHIDYEVSGNSVLIQSGEKNVIKYYYLITYFSSYIRWQVFRQPLVICWPLWKYCRNKVVDINKHWN